MWTLVTLNAVVTAELTALPDDTLARFRRIVEPHVKHLQGKLWEIRMIGRDGIARAIYVTASGRRVVILRAFVKKTQRTPAREIRLALERAKEVV